MCRVRRCRGAADRGDPVNNVSTRRVVRRGR